LKDLFNLFRKIFRKRKITWITVVEQEEGGFIAYTPQFPKAIGQGETEDEAIADLLGAIETLNEVKNKNE